MYVGDDWNLWRCSLVSFCLIILLIINNVVLRQLPLLQTIPVLHRQQVSHPLLRKYQKNLEKQGTPAIEQRENVNPGSVGVWFQST